MRIAVYGKQNENKEKFLDMLIKSFNFVLLKELSEHLLKIKKIDYIYSYDNSEEHKSLLKRGFTILFLVDNDLNAINEVECSLLKNDLIDIFPFHYHNKLTEDDIRKNFMKIINMSYQWVMFKTYSIDNTVKIRRINITRHAYQQFIKRYTLMKQHWDTLKENNFISKDDHLFYKLLERKVHSKNYYLMILKNVFFRANKLKYLPSKLKHRRNKAKRKNINSEYFSDKVFNFIIVDKAITTVEVMVDCMKHVNKITTSKRSSLFFPTDKKWISYVDDYWNVLLPTR